MNLGVVLLGDLSEIDEHVNEFVELIFGVPLTVDGEGVRSRCHN